MKRIMLTALLLSSACGQLSNDDLVFLRGVPSKQELSIDVDEDNNPNAVIGARSEFYDLMVEAAAKTNADVAGVLDFVDSIGKGYPPTQREPNKRVWGPIKNVDDQGNTIRFEVRRDGDTFTYCLHMARDAEVTGEPTCDDIPEGGGMAAILYGSYVPRTLEGGARHSDGVVTLDLEAAFQRGIGVARGKLVITHVYDQGGAAKDLTIVADSPQVGLQPAIHAASSYARDSDGRVTLSLEFPTNAIETTLIEEQMRIDSCWREGGAGRANVAISGGDLLGYRPASSVECWDAQLLRTYASFDFPDFPLVNSSEGDITTCPSPTCE